MSLQQIISDCLELICACEQFVRCGLAARHKTRNLCQTCARTGDFLAEALGQILERSGLRVLCKSAAEPGGGGPHACGTARYEGRSRALVMQEIRIGFIGGAETLGHK